MWPFKKPKPAPDPEETLRRVCRSWNEALEVLHGRALGGRYVRRTSCVTVPSFANPTSWVLCSENRANYGDPPFARFHTFEWRRDLDEGAPHSIEAAGMPRIERKTIDVTVEATAHALAPLEEVRIPVIPKEDLMGLDGTTYEFRTSLYESRAQVRWWVDGPEDWADFIRAVKETESRLTSLPDS